MNWQKAVEKLETNGEIAVDAAMQTSNNDEKTVLMVCAGLFNGIADALVAGKDDA